MKMKKIAVGDRVAFNMLSDATWFEVVQIDGFRMVVREEGATNDQVSDTSLVKQVRA